MNVLKMEWVLSLSYYFLKHPLPGVNVFDYCLPGTLTKEEDVIAL